MLKIITITEEITQTATLEIVQNQVQTMSVTSMMMEEATTTVEPREQLWSTTLTEQIEWYQEMRVVGSRTTKDECRYNIVNCT